VIAPGLLGLALTLRRRRRPHERLIAGIALVYAGSFIPFFVVDRFRCAWLPLLAPFAAAAVVALYQVCRARRWPQIAALGAGLAVSTGVVLLPIAGPTPAAQYFAFGDAELAAGRTLEAVDWYERALEHEPDHPRVLANLGVALARLGRHVEAESTLRRAADLWPGSDRVQNDLGLVSLQLGRAVEAERAFRRAIRLNPSLGEAYANLGILLMQRGSEAAAADAFRSALVFIRKGTPAEAAVSARLASLGAR
jgi:Flp pilus assembly protein TadD